jgi:hypothetical protein
MIIFKKRKLHARCYVDTKVNWPLPLRSYSLETWTHTLVALIDEWLFVSDLCPPSSLNPWFLVPGKCSGQFLAQKWYYVYGHSGK